jgi:hypothetical protein
LGWVSGASSGSGNPDGLKIRVSAPKCSNNRAASWDHQSAERALAGRPVDHRMRGLCVDGCHEGESLHARTSIRSAVDVWAMVFHSDSWHQRVWPTTCRCGSLSFKVLWAQRAIGNEMKAARVPDILPGWRGTPPRLRWLRSRSLGRVCQPPMGLDAPGRRRSGTPRRQPVADSDHDVWRVVFKGVGLPCC